MATRTSSSSISEGMHTGCSSSPAWSSRSAGRKRSKSSSSFTSSFRLVIGVGEEDGLPSFLMSYALLFRHRAAGSFSVTLSMVLEVVLGVAAVVALVGEAPLGFTGTVCVCERASQINKERRLKAILPGSGTISTANPLLSTYLLIMERCS